MALDIAQQHVDPARAANLAGSAAAAGLQYGVRMACIGEAAETEQTITENLSVRRQMARLPIPDAGIVEAAHRLDHRMGWMLERRVRLYRDQERLLVLRAAPRLAAVALPAQVGVIDLHEAGQLAWHFTLGHGLHDLVLDAPGRFVVHAQVALQLQGRHVRLGCGQQMDGQQPGAQRQLGGFEDRAAEQGGLVPAAPVLVVHLPAAAKARTPAIPAGRAAEALRPARLVQGAVGLRFGAVLLLHEALHQPPQAGHSTIARPCWNCTRLIDMVCALSGGEGVIATQRRRKSRDGGLRIGANQVQNSV